MPTESTFDLSRIFKEEYEESYSINMEYDWEGYYLQSRPKQNLTSLQKEINDLQSMGYRE